LVRAFSVYFHLINLAEEQHRVRVLSDRERSGAPLHESIWAAVEMLRAQGLTTEGLVAGLRQLEVHPVFTAHPSEARRRTLLHHLARTAELIGRLHDPRITPNARAETLDALRTRITLIWQTAETRIERPTVLDEVQSVLYFLAGTVYDVTPAIYRALERALGVPGIAGTRLRVWGSGIGPPTDPIPDPRSPIPGSPI
jgi:phosphoenolpyruvate carboxylase